MAAIRKWRSGLGIAAVLWEAAVWGAGPCGPATVPGAFAGEARAGDILYDIGSMAPRPRLGFGWAGAERAGGRTYRWTRHLEADIGFAVKSLRRAELWIEAKPLYLAYRRQVVAVYVNARYVGEWVCRDAPVFGAYRMDLPEGVLRVGENTLTLRTAYRKRIGNDSRELALCVDRILFRFP